MHNQVRQGQEWAVAAAKSRTPPLRRSVGRRTNNPAVRLKAQILKRQNSVALYSTCTKVLTFENFFLVASFVMFHSFNKNAQIRNERGHAKSANPESGTRFYTPNLAPQAWQRYVSYPSTKKPPPQPVVIYRDRLRFAERIVPVIHTPAHAHTRVC